jgi:Fe-S-cluster containining protein
MTKIERNGPCPCGSGKKYKKCCGSPTQMLIKNKKEIDFFKLNRAVAYKGRIGRMREEFSKLCLGQKQSIITQIEEKQKSIAQSKNAVISCRNGCSYCCSAYVEATLQECEVIVFYLYNNETALSLFLQAYPQWRDKLTEAGDPFEKCQEPLSQPIEPRANLLHKKIIDEATDYYARYNIPCPFLQNQMCSIYEVRPYLCAGYYTTDPAEWCAQYFNVERLQSVTPFDPAKDRSESVVPARALNYDRSFYYKELTVPIILFMPLAVHEILYRGFVYLSNFQGLKDLFTDVMSDPDVKTTIKSFYNSVNI